MPVGTQSSQTRIAVIGAGPAGLMAAETIAQGGAAVTVFDAMPSVGRKRIDRAAFDAAFRDYGFAADGATTKRERDAF